MAPRGQRDGAAARGYWGPEQAAQGQPLPPGQQQPWGPVAAQGQALMGGAPPQQQWGPGPGPGPGPGQGGAPGGGWAHEAPRARGGRGGPPPAAVNPALAPGSNPLGNDLARQIEEKRLARHCPHEQRLESTHAFSKK